MADPHGDGGLKTGLIELHRQVTQSPTMLWAAQELAYMDALMVIPAAELDQHRDLVNAIVDHLETSHTQAFYEIHGEAADGLLERFIRFADWLATRKRLEPDLFGDPDMFRVDPRQEPS